MQSNKSTTKPTSSRRKRQQNEQHQKNNYNYKTVCFRIGLLITISLLSYQIYLLGDVVKLQDFNIQSTNIAIAPEDQIIKMKKTLSKSFQIVRPNNQEGNVTTIPKDDNNIIDDGDSDNNIMNNNADGTFNGYPVYYHETTDSIYSQIHCVGSTYPGDRAHNGYTKVRNRYKTHSWIHRSCKFSFLCFDIQDKEFILYQDPKEFNIYNNDDSLMNEKKNKKQSQSNFDDTRIDISSTYMLNSTHVDNNPAGNDNNDNSDSIYESKYAVSVGGINLKWTPSALPRLKWFPKIISNGTTPKNFYTLPSNIIMVPYYSMAGFNPGHLVWDDYLPMYTLLSMFDLFYTEKTSTNDDDDDDDEINATTTTTTTTNTANKRTKVKSDLLLLRYILPGTPLWATCDFKEERLKECLGMIKKFSKLMIRNQNGRVTSHLDATLVEREELNSQNSSNNNDNNNNEQELKKSNLVCARHGIAGFGPVTDHGVRKMHGWEDNDYKLSHNFGRGGLLYKFRNFMIDNLNIKRLQLEEEGEVEEQESTITIKEMQERKKIKNTKTGTTKKWYEPPLKIVFSIGSSKQSRYRSFNEEINFLKDYYTNTTDIEIESYKFSKLSIEDQVYITSQSAIYITMCGGGAVTGMFVPKDASVILLYNEAGGIHSNRPTYKPARLDWDFFNHMSYARIHWMPGSHGTLVHNELLELVKHEINLIRNLYNIMK